MMKRCCGGLTVNKSDAKTTGWVKHPTWQQGDPQPRIADGWSGVRAAQDGGFEVLPRDANTTIARDILAASLCNAVNGVAAWDFMRSEGRTDWRYRADKVIRELAAHEWIVVPMEDVREDR
jgi:hypothetical protein